ncbi:MAG: hypothetical protein RLZZ519_3040 [Bacteroidota bacterium]|jgi:hypothetical protein
MKTIYALFTSALATVAITLMALILTACSNEPQFAAADEQIPVVPTTLVYSIEAPSGFDRDAIAYRKNPTDKPETFKIKGSESTISLGDAFAETEFEDPFSLTDLNLSDHAWSSEISVSEAVTCHAVENHEAVDESSFFLAENGRVWLYSQVELPENSVGLIQHIWKLNGEEQHRVELLVKGPTYRTASYKTMNTDLAGKWTVEIATENGEILEAVEFQVQ